MTPAGKQRIFNYLQVLKKKAELRYLPPMIVLMSEAWPGQSTRVYWSLEAVRSGLSRARWPGMSTVNDEKPKSRVMPLSLLCGFLSKHAVLAVVLKTFDKLVLPLSTWPKTPTLKLNMGAAILKCCQNEDKLPLSRFATVVSLNPPWVINCVWVVLFENKNDLKIIGRYKKKTEVVYNTSTLRKL